MSDMVKFGAAKDIITPCIRTTLMGFGVVFGKPFLNIHDDLYVRTLLLEDGFENQVILVSLDLCFHDDSLTEELRDYVNEKYGIPLDNLLITYTHTHFGPSVKGYDLVFHEPEYESFLKRRVRECVDRAYLNRCEGSIEYGFVEGSWNISRRKNENGRIRFAPALDGEHDKNLYILKLSDTKGNIKVLLTNYACHPSNLDELLSISSEYPGRLCHILESKYYGATALFFQGFGADAKLSAGAAGNRFKGICYQNVNEVALGMAERISDLISIGDFKPVNLNLASKMFKIPVPLAVYPKEFFDKASAGYSGLDGARFDKSRVGGSHPDILRWASTDYVIEHYDEIPDYLTLNCGLIRLSDTLWIATVGGEPSCNVKAVISEALAGKEILCFGYNDAIAYVPSDKVIAEGGYEAEGSVTEYRLKGRIAPGIDKLFAEYFKDAAAKIEKDG